MKTSEFAQLLQNEMILPRDPHLVARFIALLDENYSPIAPASTTAEDGVNIVPQEPEKPDYSTLPLGTVVGRDNPEFSGQEPSVADPTPVESLPVPAESEAS